jgi:hypothetical protein
VAAEEVVFGKVVGVRVVGLLGEFDGGASKRSGMTGVQGRHLEVEELLEVHERGGEPDLEEHFPLSAVAGLAHAVHFEFCEFAFDERSSFQFSSCRWSSLFCACRLESRFMEVEHDASSLGTCGATFAQ